MTTELMAEIAALRERAEKAEKALEAEADLRRQTEKDVCDVAAERDAAEGALRFNIQDSAIFAGRMVYACRSLHARWKYAEAVCQAVNDALRDAKPIPTCAYCRAVVMPGVPMQAHIRTCKERPEYELLESAKAALAEHEKERFCLNPVAGCVWCALKSAIAKVEGRP